MPSLQSYPRIEDNTDPFNGYLDDGQLVPHTKKIKSDLLRKIIISAIKTAGKKSSRAILQIDLNIPEQQVNYLLDNAGVELFKYYVKYCGDPAATAFDCMNRHYSDVAKEQFHNRSVQKERMNSGWRYQFIARDAAIASKRFKAISDLGAAEADFNALIEQIDQNRSHINIYVSIKNRVNTMGGQDWPKAIRALEQVAASDKNREGPYICVFGIAMDRGGRTIKAEQKSKNPYSMNTEIWLSDFFWPFFTNYSYQEIIHEVVTALESQTSSNKTFVDVPKPLIDSFGKVAKDYLLLDEKGNFNDAHRLADLFVLGITGYKTKYEL